MSSKKQGKKQGKNKVVKTTKPTWSLTIGNGGENHTGMEFLGNMRKKGQGWDIDRLLYAKEILENIFDKHVDLFNLNELCLEGVTIPEGQKPKDSYLMVVRGFLSDRVHQNMIKELGSYVWDRKYWDTRRQKVLNKLARANVCYGKEGREANYAEGKGTIVGFEQSPLVGNLLKVVEILMRDKDLIVEGNQYDDVSKNGIGPHGDSERVCVSCLRVGESMPMKFGMFWNCKLRGKPFETLIKGGDLYFMSEEAVGAEWKSRSKWVWRHCAGADKYLKMKGEGEESCYPKFEK